jgi:hypothetical protein
MTAEIFADYYQVLLFDRSADITAVADAWTDDAVRDRLAVTSQALGLGTLRPTTVSFDVQVQGDDDCQLLDGDHVVQTTLDVPSGQLVLAGPTAAADSWHRFNVEPGRWLVRYVISNAASVDASELHGDERYHVQLRRAEQAHPADVIRRWPAPSSTAE